MALYDRAAPAGAPATAGSSCEVRDPVRDSTPCGRDMHRGGRAPVPGGLRQEIEVPEGSRILRMFLSPLICNFDTYSSDETSLSLIT